MKFSPQVKTLDDLNSMRTMKNKSSKFGTTIQLVSNNNCDLIVLSVNRTLNNEISSPLGNSITALNCCTCALDFDQCKRGLKQGKQ